MIIWGEGLLKARISVERSPSVVQPSPQTTNAPTKPTKLNFFLRLSPQNYSTLQQNDQTSSASTHASKSFSSCNQLSKPLFSCDKAPKPFQSTKTAPKAFSSFVQAPNPLLSTDKTERSPLVKVSIPVRVSLRTPFLL